MTEKIKYTYLKHKNKRYRLWDGRDIGDMKCPKCGVKAKRLKRMDVQLGFFQNIVTYFAICDECRAGFSWRDTSMKRAGERMANEALWAEDGSDNE